MTWRSTLWLWLAVVWAAIVIPYVAIGPDDFEEYFTAVTSTKVAWRALSEGAWPFWNMDLGLGLPQPFRFHFIPHPLAPLCLPAADCHLLLRVIASLHVLLAAVFMALLCHRLTANPLLALAGAVTFCLSSSVVQPMFTDDWGMTAINEAAMPVAIYATLAIGDGRDRRRALLWTLVFGGLCGLLLSTSFPVTRLAILAVVSAAVPGWWRRLPWLAGAAAITLLMGAGQLHHIATEYALTPPQLARSNHEDFSLGAHLSSIFVRPLGVWTSAKWRAAFFGPPFAVFAAVALVAARGGLVRPLRIGLLMGVLGFVVPPSWLLDINTAQWTYRTELNVFGTLLAVYGIHRWMAMPGRARAMRAVIALQIGWMTVAFAPLWSHTLARATGLAAPGRHAMFLPGIAENIQALHRERPGRVIMAPALHAAVRGHLFNGQGLAVNQLPQLGVPNVSAVAFGVTTDPLFPMAATLEGNLAADAAAVADSAFMDVLGIRYVLALPDDAVAADLQTVRTYGDLRVLENFDAWPDAFVLAAAPGQLPLPRLPGCAHDRFLCADLSGVRRAPEPLEISRLADGVRLTFQSSTSARDIVLTQWFRPGWTVTEGRGSAARALEQLVGIHVEPGETSVTVRYRDPLRAALFTLSIATEVLVAAGIAWLAWRRPAARAALA